MAAWSLHNACVKDTDSERYDAWLLWACTRWRVDCWFEARQKEDGRRSERDGKDKRDEPAERRELHD